MSMTASTTLAENPAVQKLMHHLPDVASTVIVIALGYTLAQVGWQLLAEEEPVAAVPVVSSNQTARPQQNLSNITRSYLFGKEARTSNRQVQTTTPVSKLNAKLKGVLAANPEEFSTAIISIGKDKEDTFSVGDKIQNGVELVEIHSDHVIINSRGKYEKLVMEESKGDGIGIKRTPGRQTPTKVLNLGDIRNAIMKDPTSFAEYALPIVVKQNGKQIGYRLKPQKKGQMLSQYGIRASDVITKLNGVSLDDPQNGIKALRELSSAQSVNLTVKRGNSFVPLNITLQ